MGIIDITGNKKKCMGMIDITGNKGWVLLISQEKNAWVLLILQEIKDGYY